MVRVCVVFVADTQDEGYIPGVHAEHVVQLVDGELVHFVGLPVGSAHDGEGEALRLDVCRYVGVGENFKDVACLVTVVDPGSVRHHAVPDGVELQGASQLPSRSLVVGNARQRNGTGSVSRHVFEVQDHARNTVFHGIQPFGFAKAVFV